MGGQADRNCRGFAGDFFMKTKTPQICVVDPDASGMLIGKVLLCSSVVTNLKSIFTC